MPKLELASRLELLLLDPAAVELELVGRELDLELLLAPCELERLELDLELELLELLLKLGGGPLELLELLELNSD